MIHTHFVKTHSQSLKKAQLTAMWLPVHVNGACSGQPTPSVGGHKLMQARKREGTAKSQDKFWKAARFGNAILT